MIVSARAKHAQVVKNNKQKKKLAPAPFAVADVTGSEQYTN
jgi:hypothetical protein